MTLAEYNLNHLLEVVEKIPVLTTKVIMEGERGLTFYELRQFLTIILRRSGNTDTKRLLDDLLKTVSKLEIMRVPTPVIKKQKTISPTIF